MCESVYTRNLLFIKCIKKRLESIFEIVIYYVKEFFSFKSIQIQILVEIFFSYIPDWLIDEFFKFLFEEFQIFAIPMISNVLPSFFFSFFFPPLKKFCRVIGMAITIRDSHFSSRSPFSRSTTAIDQKEPRLILRRTRSSRFSSRNIIIISLRFFFFFLFRGMEMREWEICFWKVSIATTTVLSFLIFVHWLHIHIYIYVCMYIRNSVQLAWHNEKAGLVWCIMTGETVTLWQKLTLRCSKFHL